MALITYPVVDNNDHAPFQLSNFSGVKPKPRAVRLSHPLGWYVISYYFVLHLTLWMCFRVGRKYIPQSKLNPLFVYSFLLPC